MKEKQDYLESVCKDCGVIDCPEKATCPALNEADKAWDAAIDSVTSSAGTYAL